MTEMETGAKPAWHFWLIAVLAFVWNMGGVIDYSMSHLQNQAYMAQFTQEQLDYFNNFPAWATSFWALGVWGAFAGSILLLLRRRIAFHAFAVSIIGLIGSSFYQRSVDIPDSLQTTGATIFLAAIWVVALFLLYYSRRMTNAGILR